MKAIPHALYINRITVEFKVNEEVLAAFKDTY